MAVIISNQKYNRKPSLALGNIQQIAKDQNLRAVIFFRNNLHNIIFLYIFKVCI